MWDLIVSVSDRCLSFYFESVKTPTAPKPTKKKKDHMPYLHPGNETLQHTGNKRLT